MKRIKKYVALLLVLTMMVLCFTGCGKMTAEKLVVKMVAALAETPMTSGTMDMDFAMSIGVQGVSMDMSMGMSMDMLMDLDPYQAYMDSEVTMDMFGQSMTQTMQVYVQVEDQMITTYTHSDSLDLWQKTSVEVSAEELNQQNNYDWLKAKPVEELTLAEETQTIGDHEVYVLSCTVSGEEMQKMLSAMNSLQQTDGMDLSALEVPAVFYVDTKTFLPVQMDLEIQGMDEMMSGMMDDILGSDMASLGMEMSIGSITAVYSDIGYDAVDVPEVPQEGLDTATAA